MISGILTRAAMDSLPSADKPSCIAADSGAVMAAMIRKAIMARCLIQLIF
ncbi:hypothetical protein [Paramuribaculum intestinale]|nr:hypothetical protein [Paramuribaculum intestinale]